MSATILTATDSVASEHKPKRADVDGRLPVLERAAYHVASALSYDLHRRYASSGVGVRAVAPAKRSDYRHLNDLYWSIVAEFKTIHKFPKGSRINAPKKAALTAFVAALCYGRLFVFKPVPEDSSVPEYCLLRFVVELMKSFLGLDEADVPPAHQRDLLICLLMINDKLPPEQLRMAAHYLCIYMDALWHLRHKKPGAKPRDSFD